MFLIVLLGFVNWITCLIVVESELFREAREFCRSKRGSWCGNKLAYLVGCHLCTGTWIGLAIAAALPSIRPFGAGFIGWLLAGLAYKAIGHVTLEVTALLQRALPKTETVSLSVVDDAEGEYEAA
jgi:hypothetical protein